LRRYTEATEEIASWRDTLIKTSEDQVSEMGNTWQGGY